MLPGCGESPEPVVEEMPPLVLNSPRRALQCRSWRWSILSFCMSKDLCFDHHPAELLGELRNFRVGHAESRAPEQLRDRVIPRHRVSPVVPLVNLKTSFNSKASGTAFGGIIS